MYYSICVCVCLMLAFFCQTFKLSSLTAAGITWHGGLTFTRLPADGSPMQMCQPSLSVVTLFCMVVVSGLMYI